jgi:mono/diheme cytochrome c family protein
MHNIGMPKHLSLLTGAFLAMLCIAVSAQYAGWTIPESAKDEKSPVTATPAVLAKGKALYTKNCQRCHGVQGKGDGPNSKEDSPAADLTDDYRTPLNPDGVMFYRVKNGHPPEMPAFEKILSADDIWAVVQYAKTLRKPQ